MALTSPVALPSPTSAAIWDRVRAEVGFDVHPRPSYELQALGRRMHALVISRNDEAVPGQLDPDVQELAAAQLTRELRAAVVREAQSIGKGDADELASEGAVLVPLTGQPAAHGDTEVQRMKVVGDLSAISVDVSDEIWEELSFEAVVGRDSGGVFNAFQEHGVVHRFTWRARFSLRDRGAVAVADA